MADDVSRPDPAPADPFGEWFTRDYPRVVGVTRRVLDPGERSPASLPTAEQIAVESFSRMRHTRKPGAPATTTLLRRCLDGCMDALFGHPGSVPVHPELLGPEMPVDADLPLAELHDALATMRRADRHVGLLTLAAGYSPAATAALLQRPLDDVLERLARVATRLADARRLGLVDLAAADAR